ncbi:MAG: NADH-quinone oxidoreductase subunit F [Spirochaetae bacterium HGW-Spirochaetae-3]|jgi:formate hydrogenlyase subunit 3/multisubunit Na+/H+ antiporter MnhD subunit|nr:MAG: NADH-quinone oxidoreductase subunit F [Spirochaetae bacterium HGW-Spirochaetae-3]
MVNPLYLFACSLAAAFLLPLVDKLGRKASLGLAYATVAAWGAAALSYLWALFPGGSPTESFGTAGFAAPLAIMLRVGPEEAAGLLAVSAVGLLSAGAMHRSLAKAPIGGAIALLMALMGMSGIILTRDLFNLFVFMEISSIATYGLIAYDDRRAALRAGFKYMMAGGIASALYLIGVIYAYRFGGQLNIDLAARSPGLYGAAGTVAAFFLLAALLIELKPFPANGWAIDVYQTVDPGLSAILSGASATALLLALWKIMPILGDAQLSVVAGSGLATFAASNLVGARQSNARRMLGYSSVAQVGLVAAVAALTRLLSLGDDRFAYMVAGGLLLNHLLAKTGLFLLSRALGEPGSQAGAQRRRERALSPIGTAIAGVLAVGLVGLPPFPGFWAKWSLIRALAGARQWWLIVVILGASLVEAFYVLRWFGRIADMRGEDGYAGPEAGIAGPALCAAALAGFGIASGLALGVGDPLLWAPFAALAALLLVDRAPGWLKSLLSIAAVAAFGRLAFDRLDGLRLFFAVMLLGGGAMYSFAAMYKRGPRRGLHPLLSAATLALGAILVADSPLGFFFAWETMTLASYLLVLRGKKGERAALGYVVFGLGGAFLLMVGLAAIPGAWSFRPTGGADGWPILLIIGGLLVKLGALGVHVWLPGAYAESDDDVSGFLSSSLSKAGVFVMIVALAAFGGVVPFQALTLRALGWIGLATALFGALYAIYQEDVKKTLAWSSMGQIGYVILALAINDQAGWTTALYLALNHFLYKSMLFLAIAGVIKRVGTRNMYEMGGLIKTMPFSFLSVLMAIIALSGVPPLSGFGGKWLLYSSLLQKGWYLEAAVAFFASAVAFLYLFRLIHTIFLGQPKPSQSTVREAPLALTIPQGFLMAVLLAASAFPRLMLDPVMGVVGDVFDPILRFEGSTLVSPLGYWDGTLSMIVTIVVFALCFFWMLANLHNPQPVKQFNIVYAAERPFKPWTTHYAWSFYAPYEKALGFLTRRRGERFWEAFGTGVDSVGGAIRRVYTGNGQTYALHVVLYVVALYLLTGAL